jgi:hypothetical protein
MDRADEAPERVIDLNDARAIGGSKYCAMTIKNPDAHARTTKSLSGPSRSHPGGETVECCGPRRPCLEA